ncbi:cytochrome P450 [Saccharata proteae CBS 121410]|uniref:Cytochrome P450 n=1 Tax=Saccharata proteae CBS 121410 TaxID=1314787 RepID=A0A9P4HV59_9PEZI|nr:cytochrome P450 [Saccharata proteae CBS 121410]
MAMKQLLDSLSYTTIAALLISAYIVTALIRQVNDSRRIQRLGGRAAVRRSYVPFGLDFIYQSVRAALANTNMEHLQKVFLDWGKSENPYTVEIGVSGLRTVFTADPDNIKAILATQFGDYGKGESFNREWHDFLGDSIFTTDGDKWHTSRQLIRPQFIKDRLSDINVFEKHIQVLFKHLGGQGQTISIDDLFFRYTLDAATDFLLGRSADSLNDPQAEFAEAFAKVQHIQSLIARVGPINWAIPRGNFHRNIKIMNDFITPFVEQALRLSPEELEKRSKNDEGYTFLHAIAAHTRDRKMLRDQLAAILLAGRDTTACTLSWLFYELSTHPEIVRKLRTEIIETVGLDKAPTYEHLKSMKYLQHTLNETLRLYPVVPFNVRFALHDTTLPRGGGPSGNAPVGILANTPIAFSTLVMQRRTDIYPAPSPTFPPVDVFAPERWDHWTPRMWTYIPFNGGPRICIGQQFALTEMAYTVVRLLQRFERVEGRGEGHPGLKADIVLQPASEVKVALWEVGYGKA